MSELPLGSGVVSLFGLKNGRVLDRLGYSRREAMCSLRDIWQDREYRDCYQGLGLGRLAIFRYGSVRSCHSRQALDKVVGLTILHRYGGGDSWICQPKTLDSTDNRMVTTF